MYNYSETHTRTHKVFVAQAQLSSVQGTKSTEAFAREQILDWLRRYFPNHPIGHSLFEQERFHYHDPERGYVLEALRPQDNYWAMQLSHPCTENHGRQWITELSLAKPQNDSPPPPLFGIRLKYSDTARDLGPPIHTIPRIWRDFLKNPGLWDDGTKLQDRLGFIEDPAHSDFDRFLELLNNKSRKRPLFVISTNRNSENLADTLIDPNTLQRVCAGLAHVYVLGPKTTFALTDQLGKEWSVYNGAIRTYNPGFDDLNDELVAHPLILPSTTWDIGAKAVTSILKGSAFHASTNRNDLPSFNDVRRIYLSSLARRQQTKNADCSEQLEIAQQTADVLRQQSDEWRGAAEEAFERISEAEKLYFDAQTQVDVLEADIKRLRDNLKRTQKAAAQGTDSKIEIVSLFPDITKFDEWFDVTIGDRVLFPEMRRKAFMKDVAKGNVYTDHDLVYRMTLALADIHTRMKRSGSSALKARWDQQVSQSGVRIVKSNVDLVKRMDNRYTVDITTGNSTREIKLEWHLAKGGGRNPRNIFRQYYNWVPDYQNEDGTRGIVVIGHQTTHLDNKMT